MAEIIVYPFGGRITPEQARLQQPLSKLDELREDLGTLRREDLEDLVIRLVKKNRRLKRRLKETVPHMVTKVIVAKDAAEEWRWQIRGTNHRIIAASSEGFSSRSKAKDNLLLLQRLLQGAVSFEHVEEVT